MLWCISYSFISLQKMMWELDQFTQVRFYNSRAFQRVVIGLIPTNNAKVMTLWRLEFRRQRPDDFSTGKKSARVGRASILGLILSLKIEQANLLVGPTGRHPLGLVGRDEFTGKEELKTARSGVTKKLEYLTTAQVGRAGLFEGFWSVCCGNFGFNINNYPFRGEKPRFLIIVF